MKLIFAVLDVSLTMGLTCCYKTNCFYVYLWRIHNEWTACTCPGQKELQTTTTDGRSCHLMYTRVDGCNVSPWMGTGV